MKLVMGGFIVAFTLLTVDPLEVISQTGSGNPLKYISSCELDLTNDGKADIVLLVETVRAREAVVLVRTQKGFDAYMLADDAASQYLSCHFGSQIRETPSGRGKKGEAEGKMHKTPGAFVKLFQSEGSAAAYYWDGKGFQKVWIAD